MVFDHAFLQHLTELAPKFLEVVLIAAGDFLQHVEDPPCQRTPHRDEVRALLQHFSRDIERQV